MSIDERSADLFVSASEIDVPSSVIELAFRDTLVLKPNDNLKLNLGNHLPDGGFMRVRVRAGRTTNDPQEFTSLRLIFGAHTSNNANFSQTVSERDLPITAPADAPEFVEFHIPLSDRDASPVDRVNKSDTLLKTFGLM